MTFLILFIQKYTFYFYTCKDYQKDNNYLNDHQQDSTINMLKPKTMSTQQQQQQSKNNLTFNVKNSTLLTTSSTTDAACAPAGPPSADEVDKLKYELLLRDKELDQKNRIICKEKQEKLSMQEEIEYLKSLLSSTAATPQPSQHLPSKSHINNMNNDYARRRLHSTFQSSYIDPSDSQI